MLRAVVYGPDRVVTALSALMRAVGQGIHRLVRDRPTITSCHIAILVAGLSVTAPVSADDPARREAVLDIMVKAQAIPDACAAAAELEKLTKDKSPEARRYKPQWSADLTRARARCGGDDRADAPKPAAGDQAQVPGGAFLRGSTAADLEAGVELCRKTYSRPNECTVSWFQAEAPQRSIHVDAFSIDVHEVTNAQYTACVTKGACRAINYGLCTMMDPATKSWRRGAQGHAEAKNPSHPAVCVTWSDANDFCRWAGGRLPSEAEWEKAARGTDGRTFPWGNDWRDSGFNWGDLAASGVFGTVDGAAGSSLPGAYPGSKSPYGVHDMAGNVWEWTADWYAADFYAHGADRNPINQNNIAGKGRTVRGGSWSFAGNGARTTYRYYEDPDTRDDAIGFRCVRTP